VKRSCRAKKNATQYWFRALLSVLPSDCHDLSRGMQEGTSLRCIWCTRELVLKYGKWKLADEDDPGEMSASAEQWLATAPDDVGD